MLKRIFDFIDKFISAKGILTTFLIFALLSLCISCTKLTINNQWNDFFYYPEEEYSLLEAEADTIILKKDFNSEYELDITHYNNVSNRLSMTLTGDSATITVTVNNFGEDDQEVIKERNVENSNKLVSSNILSLVIISFFWGWVVVMIIFALCILITFIYLIVGITNLNKS